MVQLLQYRRFKISLPFRNRGISSILLCPSTDHDEQWTPEGVMEQFEKDGFMKMMEDIIIFTNTCTNHHASLESRLQLYMYL